MVGMMVRVRAMMQAVAEQRTMRSVTRLLRRRRTLTHCRDKRQDHDDTQIASHHESLQSPDHSGAALHRHYLHRRQQRHYCNIRNLKKTGGRQTLRT
jgi:hypothetical protein